MAQLDHELLRSIAERHARTPTQIVLRWSSTSNRLYDVLRATNLAAGASAFVPVPGATNLAGTPPQNTWTDSISRPSFYRLSVHQ